MPARPALLLALLLPGITPAADPAPPRRIHFAPDNHTDDLWTANEATYSPVLNEMLDYHLAPPAATAGELSAEPEKTQLQTFRLISAQAPSERDP